MTGTAVQRVAFEATEPDLAVELIEQAYGSVSVHRELFAADPARTTVTEIAARWGFLHTGHFAAHY
ncbi:hypothetical protein [Streptacidiphilus neutrinimicus]|uniref:hypothetical protein n=1 Tax=Streptacidiphilus neutrinimicus TaxID=105420 RepID=UPI0005A668A5|nr:hypothetical protein [Streptacidiphilus neutrinimicus]